MLEVAIKAAKEAGKILEDNFSKTSAIILKEDESFLTKVDRLSEDKIISIIKANFPMHSINAEESGYSKGSTSDLWLVDPLDGTTNFVTKLPFFSVSLAFAKAKKVQLGVVYDPIHQDLFSTKQKGGSKLNNKPVKVSNTKYLQDAMIGYMRHRRVKKKFVDIFSNLELVSRTPKILGSVSLQLCYLASGNLDASINLDPMPWDFAAAALIVEEAGGKVTDLAGRPWTLDSKEIVASNGKIHDQILKILSG